LKNIFSFFTFRFSLFTLLIVLCLPLLFLNIKDSHDWGDDFAQYLIQARNIIEHRPQTDNGLVFDNQTGEYALKAYPVGFPLMLAAVWKISGPSIKSFLILISLFTFAFAILIFIYLSRFLKITPLLSLLFVLAVMYNFIVLDFKKNILSDIPFAVFFLLSILSYLKLETQNLKPEGQKLSSPGFRFQVSNFHSILTGILFGLTISIRGIGIVLFIALAIKIVWQFFVNWRETGFQIPVLVFGFLTYVLLNSVFYPMPSGSFFQFYERAFHQENIGAMIQANARYYYEVLKYFFNQGGGIWLHISNITKYVMVYGLITGILFAVLGLSNRKFRFDDLVFIIYFIILFIYPYQAGQFRFWIPLIPFVLKYITISFRTILLWIGFSMKSIELTIIGLIVIVLMQNINGIENTIGNQRRTENGPQIPSAAIMFSFIRNLPSDIVVAFVKPRALSFYTNKKAAYVIRTISAKQNYEAMQRMNVHYFLIGTNNKQLTDLPMQKIIVSYKDKMRIIWQNGDFILYNAL